MPRSHPVRGAWIEIPVFGFAPNQNLSHPVRGAWIEIYNAITNAYTPNVAPREGCVD